MVLGLASPFILLWGWMKYLKHSKSFGLAIPSQLRGVIYTNHQRCVLGYYCSVGVARGLARICLERAHTAPDDGWRHLHSCAGDVDRTRWASSTNTGHRPSLNRCCAVLGRDNYAITQGALSVAIRRLHSSTLCWGLTRRRP